MRCNIYRNSWARSSDLHPAGGQSPDERGCDLKITRSIILKQHRSPILKRTQHIWPEIYSCLKASSTLKICITAGKMASIDSSAPFVDPGKASTRVSPISPETDRDNIE